MLALVFDAEAERTKLVILDAQRLSGGSALQGGMKGRAGSLTCAACCGGRLTQPCFGVVLQRGRWQP